MSDLNKTQKNASQSLEGPILVLAGAGAGKTRTLIERIFNLIINGATEQSILAVTFTNKAAKEMSDRLSKLLKRKSLNTFETNSPFIGTFHSLGVKIIRDHIKKTGLQNKNFDILDRNDSLKIIKKILKNKGISGENFEPGKILNIISKKKGGGLIAGKETNSSSNYFNNVLESVWLDYEKNLKDNNSLDFDDLLSKSLLLLEKYSEIREHYQNFWQHIHIDEYQDTNTVQYKISKILAHKHKNIFAVGDIDQNIYSWRGADISNILNFEKDYPNAKIILLEQNYRSSKSIIEAANKVIIKNKMRRDKTLFTENDSGEKIGLFNSYDEKDEANFIAHKSAEIIERGTKTNEIAVLYRANFQSRALEEAFMLIGLPFQVVGTRFFDRKEIKDLIAYLKASLNPQSYNYWERIVSAPPRGIGKVTLAKLYSGMENTLTPAVQKKIIDFKKILQNISDKTKKNIISQVITFIIDESGLKTHWQKDGLDGMERLANAQELVTFAKRYDTLPIEIGLEQFLDNVSLQSDQDSLITKKQGVKLMTIHASKGLEFDCVFISGLEDGLFPHKDLIQNAQSKNRKEEERRLFYVALTRARKKVILTYAGVRTVFGQKQVTAPSEFIFEIGDELIENEYLEKPIEDNEEKVLYFD